MPLPVHLRSVLAAITVAAALPGQADALGRARKLLDEGQQEAAAVCLYEELARLRGASEPDTRAEKAVVELLGKHDRLFHKRRRSYQAAARELVKVGQSYRRQKWFRLAARLARQAASLDASVAGGLTGSLRREVPGALKVDGPAPAREVWGAPIEAWREVDRVWTGTWSRFSPMLYFSDEARTGDEISVEVRRAAAGGQAALGFGVSRKVPDYFLFETDLDPAEDCMDSVSVYACNGTRLEQLKDEAIRIGPARRTAWIRVAVRIESKELEFFVDDAKVFTLPRAGLSSPHGNVLFHISAASRSREPVQFRNLRVGPTADALRRAVEATATMAADKPEEAVVGLLTMVEGTPADGPLKARVRALLETHCRDFEMLRGARVACGKLLRDLAAAYEGVGWRDVAKRIEAEARRVEPGFE